MSNIKSELFHKRRELFDMIERTNDFDIEINEVFGSKENFIRFASLKESQI